MISILRKKRTLFLILIVVSAFFILLGFFGLKKDTDLIGKVESLPEKSGWNTYTNKEYSFQFDFPGDWKIYEDFNDDFPVINLYKDDLRSESPPFDPFSNQNHISIFPKGSSAEEIIGKKQNIDLILRIDTVLTDAYVLTNNALWAIKIAPQNPPTGWNELGFIWFGSRISDLEYSCRSSNQELKDLSDCNPFGGDIFERSGKIEDKVHNIQLEILNTFRIIE